MKIFLQIFTVVLIFSFSGLDAQNIEFKKKLFPRKKGEYKIASIALTEGNKYFKVGTEHCDQLKKLIKEDIDQYCPQSRIYYQTALKHFLTAQDFNPNNSDLNFKIGICYLFSSSKKMSLTYFQKAKELDNLISPQIHYFIGRSYQLNSEFDSAIAEYQVYINTLSEKSSSLKKPIATKRIEECNNAKSLLSMPERVFVDNLGNTINSSQPEYHSIISTDGSLVFFTARRKGIYNNTVDPYDNFLKENIYSSMYKNKKWTSPKELFKSKLKGHLAALYISKDGNQLLVYNGDKGNGDIYVSKKVNGVWKKPKGLPGKVNSKYHESSACFSKNSDTLFFVSDRKKGFGGRDIFMSIANGSNKLQKPINLGKDINTQYNEESVFVDNNGTVYFSSQGHNSMGGYDIFKTNYSNGEWSKPQNLGYPINSINNDMFFSINDDGSKAYITSTRDGGYGEKDIYTIQYLGPDKPLMLSSENVLVYKSTDPVNNEMLERNIQLDIILKGTITDEKTMTAVEATVELINNETEEVIETITVNDKTGYYSFSIISGINYGLVATAESYLAHSEIFALSDSVNYFEITKNIKLKKVKVGTKIVLENIFFDFNKATLKPESYPELDKLAQILHNSPGLKIEISGHTDNKGSDKYNQKLSESRAKSVVSYLVKVKDVDKSLVNYKGYGESQPIATNETEEGRQLNRRTEFKILKIVSE